MRTGYCQGPLTTEKRALVTGMTGFIGSHLVRFLTAAGWSVVGLVRTETLMHKNVVCSAGVEVVAYDGTTESMMAAMTKARPSTVFHLASLLIGRHTPHQIESLIQSNLLMGTQLLEAMALNDCRFLINTGTSLQHSHGPHYNPSSLYAATKQAFESIVEYYVQAAQLSYLTLSIYSAYGPGDKSGRVLNHLVRQLQMEEALAMTPGNQKLDLIHVDDICAAFLVAEQMLHDPSANICQSYAVATGHLRSLREIASLIETIAGRPLRIEWGGRPYRPDEVMVPWIGPRLPGFEPRIRFEDGLAGMVHEELGCLPTSRSNEEHA